MHAISATHQPNHILVVTIEALPNPQYQAGVDLGFLAAALIVTQLGMAVICIVAIAREINKTDTADANKADTVIAAASADSQSVGPTIHSNPMFEAGGHTGTNSAGNAASQATL